MRHTLKWREKKDRQFLISQQKIANEHGITGILPLIQNACPQSQIVSFAVNLRAKQEQNLADLGKKIGQQANTILIISSDFSHEGDIGTTQTNDQQSLRGLAANDFTSIVNDCPHCWTVLQGFFGQTALTFHLFAQSNSYILSHYPQNITSYISGWWE